MRKILVIDPPSGWKYGFPKPVPKDHHKAEVLSAWLIEQGYPEKDIEVALKYSRYWEQEDFSEYTKGARIDDNYGYFSHHLNKKQESIDLDPEHREWEYDGDGQKVYKGTRKVFK